MLKFTRFVSRAHVDVLCGRVATHGTAAGRRPQTTVSLTAGSPTLIASFRRLGASALLAKGHSKWQNIQATKGKRDDERSRRIAHYLHQLRTVLRGGADPKMNKRLADLERDYLKESLPLDTLHRAIQRLKDKPDLSITYQLLGPGGSRFIVRMEAETRTKMQTTLTKLLKKVPDFKLTDDLVDKEFEEKGIIVVESVTKQGTRLPLDKMEEIGIELECEEVLSAGSDERGEKFELICAPTDLFRIESRLNAMDFDILSADAEMVPTGERVRLSGPDAAIVETFYAAVEEFEPIQQVTDNLVEEDSSEDDKIAAASK